MDSQTIISCGGDEQTIIGCPGVDIQTGNIFQSIKEVVGEITTFGVTEKVEGINILYLIIPLFFVFSLGFWFFFWKRRKKDKK